MVTSELVADGIKEVVGRMVVGRGSELGIVCCVKRVVVDVIPIELVRELGIIVD